MIDTTTGHFELPVVHVDKPFATGRSTQVKLVTRIHSSGFFEVKALRIPSNTCSGSKDGAHLTPQTKRPIRARTAAQRWRESNSFSSFHPPLAHNKIGPAIPIGC
jgi:hypothetical protein